jgi:hypothetical protein
MRQPVRLFASLITYRSPQREELVALEKSPCLESADIHAIGGQVITIQEDPMNDKPCPAQ